MKKTYEAMFIFPKILSAEELEDVITTVRTEIEKCGGTVNSTTRLGKRQFARVMQKQDAGHYVVITCDLEGDQITPLLARYKLNDNVFRVQIVCADPNAGMAVPTAQQEAEVGEVTA
ncbi:MAG: 30S ribosomal protein S6 [Spartobacteria bacterium]|nr:30S ribosomal protein S6 [Spartobacteria bacterium]